MLGGGILLGDSTMVVGGTGTGKTILVLQSLVNGVTQFNENGIYVTFEQLPTQVYRDAKNLGWNLRQLEAENKFRVVCTSPDLLLKQSSDGGYILDEVIRQVRPKRIAIDSLSHLEMYAKGNELRREAYRLTKYLASKDLSPMFTWESHELTGTTATLTKVGVSFLADCIISLRFVEIESSMRKAMLVLKVRGSDHDKRLREFEITSKGVTIGAPFSRYEAIMSGTPRKSWADETIDGWTKAFARKP